MRRALRGTAIHAAIQPEVRYSPVAIHRFVVHVGHRLDRKPRNASLSFSGDGIAYLTVPGSSRSIDAASR